jgi:hypothetical protein
MTLANRCRPMSAGLKYRALLDRRAEGPEYLKDGGSR